MGRKGNLAVFEGSNISETEEVMPTKIGVHTFDMCLYFTIGIGSKNSCKYKHMSNVCTQILVGVTSSVLEILLPSKTAKFPFNPIVYGHQKI